MSDKQDLPADLLFTIQVKVTFSGGKAATSVEVREELGEQPTFVQLDIMGVSTSLTMLPDLEHADIYRRKMVHELPKTLTSAIYSLSSAIHTGIRGNADKAMPKERAKAYKDFSFTPILKAIGEQHNNLADLKVLRGQKTARADLTNLRLHYDEILPKWIEAHKIYHQAQQSQELERRKRWRKAVKAVYPDLPDDLIECLQPAQDVPGFVEWFFTSGGDSKPEFIARRHAARLCGAADEDYKDSTLQKKLKPSQQKKKA